MASLAEKDVVGLTITASAVSSIMGSRDLDRSRSRTNP
jgi:hypothetical protein